VYVYNAVTGRLWCASCNPSGEAPTDEIYSEFATIIRGELTREAPKVWGSFLPVSNSLTGQQPRVISDDGDRVFFDSLEPLVPGDTNGFLDVYEGEAPGEGSCTAQSASVVTGGCTFLLSGGLDPENSYLVDASANGSDVFFVSRGQLAKGAPGGYEELYDARVGGVASPEEARCSGAGCQGEPPAAPSFATPSSLTAAGRGNTSPAVVPGTKQVVPKAAPRCKRGFVRKHGRCVRVRRRVKKPGHARRVGRGRR
jgi:hypothetical protein